LVVVAAVGAVTATLAVVATVGAVTAALAVVATVGAVTAARVVIAAVGPGGPVLAGTVAVRAAVALLISAPIPSVIGPGPVAEGTPIAGVAVSATVGLALALAVRRTVTAGLSVRRSVASTLPVRRSVATALPEGGQVTATRTGRSTTAKPTVGSTALVGPRAIAVLSPAEGPVSSVAAEGPVALRSTPGRSTIPAERSVPAVPAERRPPRLAVPAERSVAAIPAEGPVAPAATFAFGAAAVLLVAVVSAWSGIETTSGAASGRTLIPTPPVASPR
jgi:hypothetical protein